MNCYVLAWRKYAVFEGRSRRREFWLFFLIHVIASLIAAMADNALGVTFTIFAVNLGAGYVYLAYSLVVMLPGLSVMVRRLHDTGRSGWWLFRWYAGLAGGYVVAAVTNRLIASRNDFSWPELVVLLIFLLFVVAMVVRLVFALAGDSYNGSNRFGPNPKEREQNLLHDL